jgi:pimeloyl-ACP methyl ester carboxylesterase
MPFDRSCVPRVTAYAHRVGEPLRTFETPGGRTLAYAVWGDPEGFPILALHGTPGCRLGRWPREALYAELGVCFVTHDRAGYGRSDRNHGRRVVDEAADVRALADELDFDRFGVSGGSGGGPHVLACAALLPDRVVRAICDVGVAPFGAPGLEQDDWLAGMDPENVKEFGWALAGEDVLTRELQGLQQKFEERALVDPSTVLDDFDMSESDRAELARPEIVEIIRESTFEWAVNGVDRWVDDGLAFTQPWGFDLDDISVPVLVRYGMTDVFVPAAHGEWLAANVPGCVVKINDTAGHLGADPELEIAENARWLSAGIVPEGSRTHAPAVN